MFRNALYGSAMLGFLFFAFQAHAQAPNNPGGVGGSVTIGAPLPTGTNTIGGINVIAPLPGGTNSIGSILTLSSAPTAFTSTLTTTAASVLAAASITKRASFYVSGTGAGCYSFTSAAPSISGTTCTNGYPISAGSSFSTIPGVVPSTALYAIMAGGAALTIYGDYQ